MVDFECTIDTTYKEYHVDESVVILCLLHMLQLYLVFHLHQHDLLIRKDGGGYSECIPTRGEVLARFGFICC